MPPASVKTRFAASLGANAAIAAISFLAGIFLARTMGPSAYGNLMFLLGAFAALRSVLDLGASNAFYTFISSRHQPRRLYAVYYGWLAFQFTLVAALIIFAPDDIMDFVWVNQARAAVLLAFTVSFIKIQLWQTLSQIGESARNTVWVQLSNVVAALLYLAGVLILWRAGLLGVQSVLIFSAAAYFLSGLWAVYLLKIKNSFVYSEENESFGSVASRFESFCKPLVMLAAFSFAYDFADKWMVQKFSGAAQQGFYQVAFQFSAVSLLAATSILNIFWKEMSSSIDSGDNARAERIFNKTSSALLFVSGAVSAVLLPWSREITSAVLGPGYAGAWPAMALMFLYPIHQSLGQVCGAAFMASRMTKLYSALGAVIMPVGIALSYFVLAPSSGMAVPGLGMGAFGLAVKMVVLNILSVNLYILFMTRRNGWHFNWLNQLAIVLPLLVLGWGAKEAVCMVVPAYSGGKIITLLPGLMSAGVLCATVFGAVLWRFPGLAGLTREEFNAGISKLQCWLGYPQK